MVVLWLWTSFPELLQVWLDFQHANLLDLCSRLFLQVGHPSAHKQWKWKPNYKTVVSKCQSITQKYLVLTNGMIPQQKFFTPTNFEHIASDMHRHTFLLLLCRHIHRSNLSSDWLCYYVFWRCIKRNLHCNLAAFSSWRHNPQAD